LCYGAAFWESCVPDSVVEVAAWLRPWWDWCAGVTGALWWPAWSAVFSLAAFCATIWLASSNARQSRAKDAAFLIGAAAILDTAVQGARLCMATNQRSESWEARLTRTALYFDRLNCSKMIEKVDLTKFPTAKSLDAFIRGSIDTRSIFDLAHDRAEDRSETFMLNTILSAEANIKTLLSEARKLSRPKGEIQLFRHFGPVFEK
jgi:hypothetical protein